MTSLAVSPERQDILLSFLYFASLVVVVLCVWFLAVDQLQWCPQTIRLVQAITKSISAGSL